MAHAIPLPARGRVPGAAWPAGAAVATLAAGVPLESAAHPGDAAAAAADLAVALAFVVAGAAVRGRSGLTGPLLAATGVLWLAGTAADELALLHRGPLVQLLVCAPDGRPRTWFEWAAVAAGWTCALVPGDTATLALAALIAGACVGRWAAGGAVERRARAVPAVAGPALAVVLAAGALGGEPAAETVLWLYEAVLVATAAAIYAGGWRESALTSLVIDLGDVTGRGSLTGALAQAVGDPSLMVAYRRDGRWLDERGRHVELPGPGAERAVTYVEAGDGAAALVHDASALRSPGLAESVTAAVRLALENLRLRDDVAAGVREVEASRARLLRARDLERRSLDVRLRAGVGPRLEDAARALDELDGDELVAALPAELERVRAEVRRFAAGLHPEGLESGGLAAALPALAAGSPVPVDVTVDCGRLAAHVEATAWFVCSEGLANVAKHAAATRGAVRVALERGSVVVEVEDDGCGGAAPSAGRGLRGLAARVDAAGGRLEVEGGESGGTRLRATLPAEGRA